MGWCYALRPRLGSVDLAQQNNAFQPHSRYDSVAVGGLRGLRSFPTVMKERFDVVASSNMFQICGGRIAFVHNGKQVTENDCVVYFVLIGK